MSTSVQQTTEVVTRKPLAQTPQEVGHVCANMDTAEMELTAQV